MNENWTPELVESIDASWQQRFEDALESKGFAIWHCNLLTNEVSWQGDCEAFGYSIADLEKDFMTWYQLIHQEDAAKIDDNVAQILDAKYPDYAIRKEPWSGTRKLTYRLKQKDGSYVDVIDDAKFSFDKNGKATEAIGIVSLATHKS